MSDRPRGPVGVVLAGGTGARLGGEKACARLGGRPLIDYPVAALRAVVGELAVVAKEDTALPVLAGVDVWREPQGARHPLAGIVEALTRAAGRDVLVCAVDLPLVSAEAVRRVAAAEGRLAVAIAEGRTQPLLGLYRPGVLDALRVGLTRQTRMTELVAELGASTVEVEPEALFNVNTPEDLLRAEELLASRR